MNNCEELIRPALSDAVEQYEVKPADSYCTIVTPYQHPNGDLITLHVEHFRGELYTVRDFGEVFAMLRLYGVDPSSSARKGHIKRIRDQFDLENIEGEVVLRTNEDELGSRIRDGVQAVQAISHLVYTHTSQPPSRFRAKVESFLDEEGYDFTSGYSVDGVTHPREFDIGINHRDPNVLLDTIHSNTATDLRRQADGVMLNWHEIQDMNFSHGAIIDNEDGEYDEAILGSLIENLDYFYKWTDREDILQDIPVQAH